MPSTSDALSPDLATLCAARAKALRAYDTACQADGVTGSVWRLIASDIDAACDALESRVGADHLRSTRARARDARERAVYAERMVDQVAAQYRRRQSIPVIVVIEVVS